MKKKLFAVVCAVLIVVSLMLPASAAIVPDVDTHRTCQHGWMDLNEFETYVKISVTQHAFLKKMNQYYVVCHEHQVITTSSRIENHTDTYSCSKCGWIAT